MKLRSLDELFLHELKGLHSAETQLDEEGEANKKLTALAESGINTKADK